MGCVGPKSAIEVRDGMTFLDLSVRQIEVSKTKKTSCPKETSDWQIFNCGTYPTVPEQEARC